ncbi:hypothetical protein J3E72DRAFT_380158 [Bipolaris maydis]|nr:hypothetical protein J3E72DRAFT_380158 [Bipolaris maydis]
MANRKYPTIVEARKARQECNRLAQQRYRERLKQQRQISQASPSDNPMRDKTEAEEEAEEEGEETIAVAHPVANAQEALAENVQGERREPDPLSPSLVPSERVASIDRALDQLLANIEDPCVRKSLQDPIARIELKFRDLVNRVHRTEQPAVQQDESLVPTIHCNSHASAGDWNRAHNMSADTIASLSAQIYRYRAQHMNLTEIESLSAHLERARGLLA